MGPFIVVAFLLLLSLDSVLTKTVVSDIPLQASENVIGYALTAACVSKDARELRARIELQQDGLQEYGPSFTDLVLHVKWDSGERLHVHLTTPDTRWEVPQDLLPRPPLPLGACDLQPAESFRTFRLENSSPLAFSFTRAPFGFAVSRRSSGEVLFNSTPPIGPGSFFPLVFKDQYLEISTSLPPSASLYGLGESTRPSGLRLLPNETYTLWASDISASSRNIPLYGVHPFYTDLRENGAAHGVLFLNSNGMDASLTAVALSLRAIGGVFDLYFFAGPDPLAVVRQYTDLVGKPAPVPYWALGFHQCRWGYKTIEELRQVAANYSAAEIPLDALWSDIDYMDRYEDFTTDPVNYPAEEMRDFVAGLHEADQHYVVIIDPGIKVEAGYPAYEDGLLADVFVRYPNGTPALGQVWPGPVHYPDFVMHPGTVDYWEKQLAAFHQVVPYDGLWIDMNEASNFCSAVHCALPDRPHPGSITDCFLDCSDENATTLDVPPYRLNILGDHHSLGTKTIPMSALHHGGVPAYNVHNLYGFAEGRATHLALRNISGKRPFVLSRSTFSGAGAWAAHWSGDNTATWDDLRYSLVSILNMGLFGVPHVGADICGFVGTTSEELCLRWIQAGSMYPFSRDHSDIKAEPQELYRWPSVTVAARASLALRYRLLPFLYTLTFRAHRTGEPIARPLFMEVPGDPRARAIDAQFLLGPGLLVSPVLSAGASTVDAYFPQGTWYSLVDDSRVVSPKGTREVLPAPRDTPPPVHVRGGTIVPMQQGGMTVAAARKTPFTILVALPDASTLGEHEYLRSSGPCLPGETLGFANTLLQLEPENEIPAGSAFVCAAGDLFLDGGEDLEMKVAALTSTYVTFRAAAVAGAETGVLSSLVEYGQFAEREGYIVDEVVILGVESRPKVLFVNGQPAGKDVVIKYDGEGKKLEMSHLGLPLSEPFHLRWAASTVDLPEDSGRSQQ
ncbi:Glycoside hydrolase [Klebsormidium nitens]|uniref:Maltase n=1 Tax=Klebsormidium nitens TaxID=105231 RepID=A0A1Y1IEZ2_KLENI|nr:Glycoside hydrolase [Klebsormidium nitens]|eukprot:GAQ89474.1 Glycoside hydrolase [Klebsormidium nitens]